MRTLHMGLRVADRERSLAFYAALGYEVIGEVPETRFGRLTMLKLPGDEFVTIELVDGGPGGTDPGGLNHFVIAVESMEATLAGLAERGVDTEAPSSPDDSETFFTCWVTDPDNRRIELVQWPPGHADGMSAADFAG